MNELSTLGFGPFFEQQLPDSGGDAVIPARISSEHRGAYEVWSSAGVGRARLSGPAPPRARRDRRAGGRGLGAHRRGARTGAHGRPSSGSSDVGRSSRGGPPGGRAGRRSSPPTSTMCSPCVGSTRTSASGVSERYLARIWASGAPALGRPDEGRPVRRPSGATRGGRGPRHRGAGLRRQRDPRRGHRAPAGRRRRGHDRGPRGLLPGAGKSTLVNALLGEERMRTGEVAPRPASDGRGCHVTTHRQLVLLPGGGLLLDTPGMRELQLLDDDGPRRRLRGHRRARRAMSLPRLPP